MTQSSQSPPHWANSNIRTASAPWGENEAQVSSKHERIAILADRLLTRKSMIGSLMSVPVTWRNVHNKKGLAAPLSSWFPRDLTIFRLSKQDGDPAGSTITIVICASVHPSILSSVITLLSFSFCYFLDALSYPLKNYFHDDNVSFDSLNRPRSRTN